jgi:hypothetical protein
VSNFAGAKLSNHLVYVGGSNSAYRPLDYSRYSGPFVSGPTFAGDKSSLRDNLVRRSIVSSAH